MDVNISVKFDFKGLFTDQALPCSGFDMNPLKASEIFNAGRDTVVTTLISMGSEIRSLQQTVEDQKVQIATLLKNSSNSSKPPSSDDVTKPKPKKPGNRKIGAQPGHSRHTRPLFPPELIKETHDHPLACCPDCREEVIMLGGPPRIIQQVEIPKQIIIRHEHRAFPYWCINCNKIHYASFPPEVVKQGLIKTRLTALIAYMSNVCHASFSTIRKYLRDVMGEPLSRGVLAKIIQKVSQSLEKPYEELLKRLPLEQKLNVDETGHKENGDRFWTWVFKAELYVLFRIDKSRGSKVLIDVLGEEFNGVLGCDYFSSYKKFMKDFDINVQFCIAHLIRNIKFLISLPDAESKAYGKKLLAGFKELFKTIHNRYAMSESEFQDALKQTARSIIATAVNEAPSSIDEKGKERKKAAQNMANRFRQYGEAYFTFITTPGIDPTNNIAEQAIRFIVIDRHIKQGTRSINGRIANERLWTVIATCAMQGRSAFNFILRAVEAYFSDSPAPSLLPVPDTS